MEGSLGKSILPRYLLDNLEKEQGSTITELGVYV